MNGTLEVAVRTAIWFELPARSVTVPKFGVTISDVVGNRSHVVECILRRTLRYAHRFLLLPRIVWTVVVQN